MKIMTFTTWSFILSVLIFVVSTTKIGHAQTSTKSAISNIGTYEFDIQKGKKVGIEKVSGGTSLDVGNQLPRKLIGKDEANFNLKSMSSYSVKELCAADNKLTSSKLVHPNSKFSLNISLTKQLTADELIAKVIKASGGEKNIRKLASRATKYEVDFVNQGMKGYGTDYAKAPNKTFSKTTLTAQNKEIGYIAEYFDGKRGSSESNLYPIYEYTGKALENLKFRSDFYGFLDLNEKIEKAEILRKDKFAGEDVYVLLVKPKRADRVTYFISAKTFLVLRGDYVLVIPSSPSVSVNTILVYENYKKVDGVLIPFKVTGKTPALGGVLIMHVKGVKHNVKIPDKIFRKRAN